MKGWTYHVLFGIDASAPPETHARQRMLADMSNHTMDQVVPIVLRQAMLMPEPQTSTLVALNIGAGLAAQMAALCAETLTRSGSSIDDALTFYERLMDSADECFRSIRLQTHDELRAHLEQLPRTSKETIHAQV